MRLIATFVSLALLSFVGAADQITGCLDATKGVLYHVAEASAPMAPCNAGDRQLSWNVQGPAGPPGPSGSAPKPFTFVGVTTATFDGSGNGGGWTAMSQACAVEFAGSRMAFSDELRETVDWPTIPHGAWVQARPAVAFRVDTHGRSFLLDRVGNEFWLAADGEGFCRSWTSNTNHALRTVGFHVSPSGAITSTSCDRVLGVACAAPAK